MQKIYFLDRSVRFDDQFEYTSSMQMETILCPINAGLPSQHAMRQRWRSPIKAVGLTHRMTDFEWTVYRDLLLEMDVIKKLSEAGFSGVEFEPAELYSTTEIPISREVFQLKVIGWGGLASPESGIHVIQECPHCKRTVFSGFTNPDKIFSAKKWDGSDFFIIWPMPKYIFVTERVAGWIAKNDFSGVCAKPLDKFPKSVSNSFSPGHLQDWFDEPKLSEIMKSS